MFPFRTRLRWHVSSRALHLVRATHTHLDWFAEPFRSTAIERSEQIRRWQRLRGVLLILLAPSWLAAAIAAAAQGLPALEPLQDVGQLLLRIATTAAGVLTGVYLLVSRLLDQLAADLSACLSLGATRAAHDALHDALDIDG